MCNITIVETIWHGPGLFTIKCASPDDCKMLTDAIESASTNIVTVKFAEERNTEVKMCNIGNKYLGYDYIHSLTTQLHEQNSFLKSLNGTCPK